jgi:hypothetical protein
MRDGLALTLLSASYVVIGHAVAGRVTRQWVPGIGRLAIAYVVGCLIIGLTASYLALGGVGLSFWIVLVIALAAAVKGTLCLDLRAFARSLKVRRSLTASGAAETALVTAICVFGVILVIAAAVGPLTAEDGWAIWGLKAHALFSNGGVQSPVFTATAYERSHTDYPLLFPALEALEFRAIGRFDQSIIDTQIAVFATSASLAVWSVLRLASWRWLAAGVALALLGLPACAPTVTWNNVDVPLALMVTLAAVLLARWLEVGDRASLWGAALFLAGAAATKNEGQLFAVILVVAAAIVPHSACSNRRTFVTTCGLALGLAIIPWRIWLLTHGIRNSDLAFSHLLDLRILEARSGRVGPAGARLLAELVGTASLALLTGLGVSGFLAALATGQRRVPAFLALWTGGSFAALVAAYWISRWPLEAHLDTSASRIVFSLAFVGAALSTQFITRAAAIVAEADRGTLRSGSVSRE